MKDTLTDANFPRTADERVYHLGLRPGEVANRIVTVGSPSRAHRIAALLDTVPQKFSLSSERGFLTITGRYKSTPISVISIGMGHPNMDFFVREVRESLAGDMVVVRLGSCGSLIDVPVGSVSIPRACVAVMRDFDFDFSQGHPGDFPYKISKQVLGDPDLHLELEKAVEASAPPDFKGAIRSAVNASADSFYSSQGRQTSFPDFNQNLIERLQASIPDVETLEMETFHLYHLASCWTNRPSVPLRSDEPPPLTTRPVHPTFSSSPQEPQQPNPEQPPAQQPPAPSITEVPKASDSEGDDVSNSANMQQSSNLLLGSCDPSSTSIKAAAVQMIFASRTSQAFITPEQVTALETWTGRAVLEALCATEITPERLHVEKGSVWEMKS